MLRRFLILARCAIYGHQWRDKAKIEDGEYAYIVCERCGNEPTEPWGYR